MTDQELIAGIIANDRRAVSFLVEKYQRRVIKTAFHFLGIMEDAEDLSQDIFLGIINSLPAYRKEASLDTWIYRITVNKSLNLVKKNNRKGFIIRLESVFGFDKRGKDSEPSSDDLNKTHEADENRKLLYQSLEKLPENQRIAFVLHNFDDLSYKEISTVMNVSLSSVESLIHRAKQNLRARLSEHFTVPKAFKR